MSEMKKLLTVNPGLRQSTHTSTTQHKEAGVNKQGATGMQERYDWAQVMRKPWPKRSLKTLKTRKKRTGARKWVGGGGWSPSKCGKKREKSNLTQSGFVFRLLEIFPIEPGFTELLWVVEGFVKSFTFMVLLGLEGLCYSVGGEVFFDRTEIHSFAAFSKLINKELLYLLMKKEFMSNKRIMRHPLTGNPYVFSFYHLPKSLKQVTFLKDRELSGKSSVT